MSTSGNSYGLGSASTGGRRVTLAVAWLVFLVLHALCCMSFATQRTAAYFGYHKALGAPIFMAAGIAWHNPLKILSWHAYGAQHEAVRRSVAYAEMIFLAPQFLIVGVFVFGMRKPRGRSDLHGSAKWAVEEEIRKMGYLNGTGVYVGGWLKRRGGKETLVYLRHNGPEHILAFAPTRSGKGVGLILPTLYGWEHSTLVFDIKGENWALTSGYLQSRGNLVLKFDPADPGGASASYNPLEEIRLHNHYAISDAQNLTQNLLDPEGKGFEGNDAHWKKNAAALLSGVMLHCMLTTLREQKRPANLTDLSYMFRSEAELWPKMQEEKHEEIMDELFGKAGGHDGKNIHEFISAAAQNIASKPENERGSVISTAVTDLALYRDPIITRNIARSSFRLEDLMHHEKPVNLYLVVAPGETVRLRLLIRILITQLIHHVTAKMEFADGATKVNYRHRLLFMLDELTALGKIDILEKAIAYIAGYGGKLYLIVQDLLQLQGVYGKENALMSNCHVRIAYAPNNPETAKVLSEMAGKTTVVEEKTSLSGSRTGMLKSASVSVSETARPLLTPDECSRLPAPEKDADGRVTRPGDMLIFTAGQSPIYGKQILYFLDPVFSRRSKVPAPARSDVVRFAASEPEARDAAETANAPDATDTHTYAAYLEKKNAA